ncbi:hypothetical protein JCM8115_000970 [Rhodotorula mucilaginosa]|uniref:Uncharacterized protein n=1 Tax=Rhodotorula mucilaginosa TaxID=5537 RepID=A0A9P7B2M2_RHOMI|nr:hypothetical protein C6P46_000425 [Rhodotorula mucilaginosa]TKA54267.1 hypothetical protein B0A53_03358 [Rhodotorula sp. CCFEE 5036]
MAPCPATPTRTGCSTATTPPPLRRPNRRKRPLPSPSPIAMAFNLGDRTSASTWSRNSTRAVPLFGASNGHEAPPAAPLLPPAPVFEVLPLPPDTPISPLGPHSIPMSRSPAISSLSQFTIEAQREAAGVEKQDERKWVADSISRFELKAFRAPLVKLVDDSTHSRANLYTDEQADEPLQAFHLELTSPDLAPLRNPRPTRTSVPLFDESAHSPDTATSALSGLSWSSSLPSLSTSSSSTTLSGLDSRSPSPFSSPVRLVPEAGHSPRCRSPAFDLAKSLSITTLNSEHRAVSNLALRRFEKRHRERRAAENTSPVLGLGLTLNP